MQQWDIIRIFFFFSSRRRHTRLQGDWSSDVCSSDLVTPQETEAHRLYDLGNGQWNIPALRHLLEQILPHHTAFDDFEITHTFPHLGPKSMLLNARQIVHTAGSPPLMLLTIEDITARRQAEAALRQQRDLLA